ncbi:MAG: hypothetical protein K2H87_06130 [Duncaniella sp.]|nr:hypothetical protein [Duncaniella sp.]
MESIETLIPDDEGNYLVVVLYFYDERDKSHTFQIPEELSELEIADININKLDIDRPLHFRAFYRMCRWLIEQFMLFPNAVFSYICSTDTLETRHGDIEPERFRWQLFETLFGRYSNHLSDLSILNKELMVGPEGFQTYAKVFYRSKHSPVINIVISHLTNKYQI